MLTIVDAFSRRSPSHLVERRIRGCRVVQFLEELAFVNGYPEAIVIGNGPDSSRTRSTSGRTPTTFVCTLFAQAPGRSAETRVPR